MAKSGSQHWILAALWMSAALLVLASAGAIRDTGLVLNGPPAQLGDVSRIKRDVVPDNDKDEEEMKPIGR